MGGEGEEEEEEEEGGSCQNTSLKTLYPAGRCVGWLGLTVSNAGLKTLSFTRLFWNAQSRPLTAPSSGTDLT